MLTKTALTCALFDLVRASLNTGRACSLIGEQALSAYGVPVQTIDRIEVLVYGPAAGTHLAYGLADTFAWMPLVYHERSSDYVAAGHPSFGADEPDNFLTMVTPLDVHVRIFGARNAMQKRMVSMAKNLTLHDISMPVAPLGGVLGLKAKSPLTLDRATVERAAESLSAAQLVAAVAWAETYAPAEAAPLKSAIAVVKKRRTPIRLFLVKRSR